MHHLHQAATKGESLLHPGIGKGNPDETVTLRRALLPQDCESHLHPGRGKGDADVTVTVTSYRRLVLLPQDHKSRLHPGKIKENPDVIVIHRCASLPQKCES